MRHFVSKFFMLLLLLLLLIQPVQAKPFVGIDEAFICQTAAEKFEKEYQIKEHLLETITTVETGRWNQEHKQTLAWPWTVNALGKGYYYSSKAEAVKAVKDLQAKGVKSIDVGCMQINLMYHGKEFKSVEEALDPYKNVEYGAKFLKQLYKRRGNDWFKAAMAYHSGVLKKALRYKKKIVVAYDKVKKNAQLASLKADEVQVAKSTRLEAQALISAQNDKATAADKANAWRESKLSDYRNRKVQ